MVRSALFAASILLSVACLSSVSLAQADPNGTAQLESLPPLPPGAGAQEFEQRGDELRERRQPIEALDCYNAALKLDPGNPSLLNKTGIANLQVERFGLAKHFFERAVKANRNAPEAYNNLGVIAYLQKKYRRAIGEYQKAIQLDPNSASFHSNLGTAHFARKDFQSAIAEYTKAWVLDPDVFVRSATAGVNAHLMSPEDRAHFDFLLARMYAENHRPDEALHYLRRAIEEGYARVHEVYESAAFASLRTDPRFAELMQSQLPPIR
jgi:tetratricopeptide (TPR) repeat protein